MCSTVVRPARLALYIEERVRGRGPDVERDVGRLHVVDVDGAPERLPVLAGG